MPNIASTLKEEITRLARKELKKNVEVLKKNLAAQRSELVALKRSVANLEKQVRRLNKISSSHSNSDTDSEPSTKLRFSAKGLFSQRKRLGLSAADLGKLLGVTAQSVYNWEAGKTRPRPQQLESINAIKKLGKRQVNVLLEASRTVD